MLTLLIVLTVAMAGCLPSEDETLGDLSGFGTTGFAGIPGEGTPLNLTAVEGNGRVTLDWQIVHGSNFYSIYRELSPGVTKSSAPLTFVSVAGYLDGGLTNGTTYYYVVTATDSSGESNESNEVSATPFGAP